MSRQRPRDGLDLRVMLVTSGAGPEVADRAAECAAAGVGVVQVRHKTLTDRELLALLLEVAERVKAVAPLTRVVVDDRVEVAAAAMRAGAHVHGVHLGQDDMPVAQARSILGPGAVIGLTTGTLELVQQSADVAHVVDYLGAGPFRPTPTKDSGRPPLGFDGYPPLVGATALPIVAIGSITTEDVPGLAATGVAGVAMVRELMGAADAAERVRRSLSAFEGAGRGCRPMAQW